MGDISMDFIEGLPKSQGYSVILVVVDRFTKYSHFMPLKHPYTVAIVAELFFNNVVKLHSMPLTITSDRDKKFTSNFWKELFKLWGTQLQMSTAYHPQNNGQTEGQPVLGNVPVLCCARFTQAMGKLVISGKVLV